MGLSEGYKQTEVGVLPEDWEVKPFSSVVRKVRIGGNYANQDTESEFPLMKMGNVARGYFDISKIEYIKPGVIPENRHRLISEDVLFNTRNTLELVGKVAIWRDEIPMAFYNSNLMRLEFDDRELCSNEYANYALNTSGSISRLRGLATGTTSVAAIYTRDLAGLPFIVPPKIEQRAIATALSDVDALLYGLDRLIAKKRDIKQAAMQQLLTGKTRLPGFEGEWEIKSLDQIAEIRSGGTPSTLKPNFWDGDIPWCTPTDITGLGGGKYLRETSRTITTAGLRSSSAELISCKSIIMTSRATIGECAINIVPTTTNQGFKNLVPHNDVDYEFLYYLMTTKKRDLLALCAGSTFLEIGKRQLKGLEISLPRTIEEQAAIAAILSDMDAEIDALEQRRAKTRDLKKAMMQELLTGRTRLI